MSKAHRGSGIREQVKSGRGTCPVCKKTGIKVLYEREIDGTKTQICKRCNATLHRKQLNEKQAEKQAQKQAEQQKEKKAEQPAEKKVEKKEEQQAEEQAEKKTEEKAERKEKEQEKEKDQE